MKTAKGAGVIARACQAGADLFAEHGYGETTTRQLSAAIGVTNGTFYHHFASKEDLLRQVCEGALEQIISEVQRAVAAADDPIDALEALVRTHLSVIANSRNAHVVMLAELRSLRGTNRDVVVAARDAYERLVRDAITAAQDAGRLRADLEANTQSLLLLNLMNWTIFWFEPGGDLSIEELADRMLSLFLHGALRHESA